MFYEPRTKQKVFHCFCFVWLIKHVLLFLTERYVVLTNLLSFVPPIMCEHVSFISQLLSGSVKFTVGKLFVTSNIVIEYISYNKA